MGTPRRRPVYVQMFDTSRVAIEVPPGPVIAGGRAWVGVASRDLGAAQRHAGVENAGRLVVR